MARDQLPVLVNNILPATEFRYFDWIELTLPMNDSDTLPIVIRASKADFLMTSFVSIRQFIVETFINSLRRMPTEVEYNDWYNNLGDAFNLGVSDFVAAARTLLGDLFFSGEYDSLSRTPYEIVTDLFSTIYNRSPTAIERATKTAIVISLGAGDSSTAMLFSGESHNRLSTIVSNLQFTSDIKNMSDIVITEGRAMDNADFTINNRDEMYSTILSDIDRNITPARAVIGRAFYVGNQVFESDILMIGSVIFGDINLSEFKITVISDTSRQGIKVVKEIGQRCSLIYKGPGCDTADPSPTCSRIKTDAVNGCQSKIPAPQLVNGADDNRPSFFGVAKLASHPTTPVGTGIGHGGWGQLPDDPRDHINHSPFEPLQL